MTEIKGVEIDVLLTSIIEKVVILDFFFTKTGKTYSIGKKGMK